mgnify:FL=1|tara:strand:+ start:69 stop:596 length:528 start_codon:yes stop_codon:yes gene_type:complete
MNSFEIQKVISAILITILVVFGIGKISNFFFNKDPGPVVAYKVDAPEGSEKDSKKDSQLDLNAMFALADLAHGEKVFKKCAACHSIKEGGGNKIGPKLWNVMFRPVGAVEDYKYSKSLMSYKKEWTWEEMNGFLIKPSSWIKGNKMGFAGLKDEKDRASVILYLNQNSDNPRSLP